MNSLCFGGSDTFRGCFSLPKVSETVVSLMFEPKNGVEHGVERSEAKWSGVGRSGAKWSEVEWSGVEWSGVGRNGAEGNMSIAYNIV